MFCTANVRDDSKLRQSHRRLLPFSWQRPAIIAPSAMSVPLNHYWWVLWNIPRPHLWQLAVLRLKWRGNSPIIFATKSHYTANSQLSHPHVWRPATCCFLRFSDWPISIHRLSGIFPKIALPCTLAARRFCIISLASCRPHSSLRSWRPYSFNANRQP